MKTLRVRIVLVLLVVFLGTIFAHGQAIFSGDHLTGTKLMTPAEVEGIRPQMLEGMRLYFEKELRLSPQNREAHWARDYSSVSGYLESVSSNRSHFKSIIGAVDERIPVKASIFNESTLQKAVVSETEGYTVYNVSWPVLTGVTGTGLWVEPRAQVKAQVVVLPDAGQSPEMIMGLSPGSLPGEQFARGLAEAGCRIIIPLLIDRNDTWSGNPDVRMTNQPHREFIYRRAYELGRHIIGYEVQKVLAAVDWFTYKSADLPVAVAGYGEGGLIALYSGAVDTRIKGVMVSGYFQAREGIWMEPIYRNVCFTRFYTPIYNSLI